MSPIFTVTDSAAEKISEISRSEATTTLPLRVAVRPGGCSGFSYEMFFDEDMSETDLRFSVRTESSSVDIVLDEASAPLLRGATLDYSDGLSGSGFKFVNPNATRTCGCGKSFS